MKIQNYWKAYKQNIKRTHRHKVAYAIDEYKQFGYNTLDSITHDSDKMLLYIIGVPHSKVSRVHRSISEHHVENNLKKNIKSMFLDIHCSQEKPDKSVPFRDYFYKAEQLKKIKELEKLAIERNFGEKVSISELRQEVDKATSNLKEFIKFSFKTLSRLKRRS